MNGKTTKGTSLFRLLSQTGLLLARMLERWLLCGLLLLAQWA